jgi:hypothetical protein
LSPLRQGRRRRLIHRAMALLRHMMKLWASVISVLKCFTHNANVVKRDKSC